MPQGVAAMVACALVWAAPAHAQTAPVPTKSAPIVVAGVPVTVAQAQARTGRNTAPFQVRDMRADLVQARIVAGEAALRGVSADPDEVAAAVAREQLHSGGEAYWRSSLKQRGIDEGEARAQIAERVLSDALVDAITAAKADARTWGGFVDLAGILNPEWSGALCQPGDAKVLPRLRAYLKRTAPGVLRRATFDADCDPQSLQTPRRADLVVILHAVARIAAHVRRGGSG